MDREKVNLRVLYIEDEQETREEMMKFLKRRFTRVTSAANGKEGLEKAASLSPDIIIADLLMDGMGGIEMLEELRRKGDDSRVLITSALEDSRTILKTVDLGIENYIIKPIDTVKLDAKLNETACSILKQRGKLLELAGEQRAELEKRIRTDVSAFMKKKTGKGPKNIDVFTGGNRIEILLKGSFTPFDECLTADRRNHAVVEEYRRVFYRTGKAALEELVSEASGLKLRLTGIEIDIGGGTESLVFKD